MSLKKYCSKSMNKALIAMGSNKGNRFENFSKVSRILRKFGKVIKTSQIYENPCLRKLSLEEVSNENPFLNGAIHFETEFSKEELLRICLAAEIDCGHDRNMNKNLSREMDLDIIFFNDVTNENSDLILPHPRWSMRPFVLKPLLDLTLGKKNFFFEEKYKISSAFEKILIEKNILHTKMYNDNIIELNLKKTIPLRKRKTYLDLTKKYKIRSINCFSRLDEGIHPDYGFDRENDRSKELDKIIRDNIDIIEIVGENIGDYNPKTGVYNEMIRVISMIDSIRRRPELKDKIISVKTNKSKIVQEVLDLDIDIINDNSGSNMDSHVARLVAKHNIPMIITFEHAHSFDDYVNRFTHSNNEGFAYNLNKKIDWLVSQGIDNWNIIVESGLAKSMDNERINRLLEFKSVKKNVDNTFIYDDIEEVKQNQNLYDFSIVRNKLNLKKGQKIVNKV